MIDLLLCAHIHYKEEVRKQSEIRVVSQKIKQVGR